MNERLTALVREVLGLGDGVDVTSENFVAFVKKANKEAYQAIFDDGHGVAVAQQQKVVDRLTTEKTTLTTERDQLKSDLTTARKGQPDLEKLQNQIDEKDAEIVKLKEQGVTDKRLGKVDQTLEKLRAKLAAKLNDGYEEILVERPATRQLFSFDDEGNFRILRPGKSTPFAGDEEAQLDSLTGELLKDVKAVFKRSDVRDGSSSGLEQGGGGGKAATFDKIREDAKKTTGESPADVEKELNRRLGLGTA